MKDELRDIKPLLEIPDSSYELLIMGLSVALILALIGLFVLARKLWTHREVNMQKIYFEAFKNIEWSDSKKASYEVTYLGRLLATEPRTKEIYAQLVPMLDAYKYRKNVPTVDSDTLQQYNLLVHVIDESI
ncbi:MAG: hypothetical protein KAG56_10125 [Sulfurovaceae bacterium]|nr:hypothetical protein [Sulfurovaceae bacterium]